MNRSIKNRLRLMATVTAIGTMIMLGFIIYYVISNNQMNQEKESLYHHFIESKEINSTFIQIRKDEQTFLRTKNPKDAELVQNELKELKENIVNYQKENKDNKKLNNILEKLNTYEDAFKLTANMVQQIEKFGPIINQEAVTLNKQLQEITDDGNVEEQFLETRLYEQKFLVTGDKKDYEGFLNAIDKLEKITEASEQSTKITLFKYTSGMDSIKSYQDIIDKKMIEFENIAMDVGKSTSDNIKDTEKSLNRLNHDQSERDRLFTWTLLILSIILIAINVYSGVWLNRSITKSITNLKNGAAIIGQGNLAFRVKSMRKDEMGELAETFNQMASIMQQSLQKVSNAAVGLSSSSQHLTAISEETTAQTDEVASSIGQVAAGAQNQAEQLLESTELIAKVTTAVQKTAHFSNQISLDSLNAEQEGNTGIEVVNQLHQNSNEFLNLASHLIDEVQNANGHSQKISSIVDTIKDIAGSTDLLALNAAIESARAGEAGRGFSVVAQEIRKLAEKSRTEAQNIHSLVSVMSEQMTKLSTEAEQFNQYKTKQEKSVKRTEQAFNSIVTTVKGISNRVQEIISAINEVQDANENLTDKLQEVSAISEESVAASEEVNASSIHQKEAINEVNLAANELQEIALLLQEEVSQFILSNEVDTDTDTRTNEKS